MILPFHIKRCTLVNPILMKSLFVSMRAALCCLTASRAQDVELSIDRDSVDRSTLDSGELDLRKLAVNRLADQKMLGEVARTDRDPEVRKLAVARLGGR